MFEIKFDAEYINKDMAQKAGTSAYIPISIEKSGNRVGKLISQNGYFHVFIGVFLDVGLTSFNKLHSGQTVPFELEYSDILFEGSRDTVEIYIHDKYHGEFGDSITVELQTFAAAMISFAEEFVAYCREEEVIEESNLEWIDEQISEARTWYSQTCSEDLE